MSEVGVRERLADPPILIAACRGEPQPGDAETLEDAVLECIAPQLVDRPDGWT